MSSSYYEYPSKTTSDHLILQSANYTDGFDISVCENSSIHSRVDASKFRRVFINGDAISISNMEEPIHSFFLEDNNSTKNSKEFLRCHYITFNSSFTIENTSDTVEASSKVHQRKKAVSMIEILNYHIKMNLENEAFSILYSYIDDWQDEMDLENIFDSFYLAIKKNISSDFLIGLLIATLRCKNILGEKRVHFYKKVYEVLQRSNGLPEVHLLLEGLE
jgi:hypothetical protein